MEWQPNSEGLQQILTLLRNSQNPEYQKQIHEQLQSLQKFQEFNNYLVYVFTKMNNEPAEVRQMAGLLLKNNVKDSYGKMPPEVQNYIKMQILVCLADPQVTVRRTVATIVTTILLRGGVTSWPKILDILKEGLETTDESRIDGSFYTLTLICEDHNYDLDSAELGRPLNSLIPLFLKYFTASSEIFRRYALQCMNQFITALPGALLTNMDNFIKGLFYLAADPSPQVQKLVCRALAQLTSVRVSYLLQYLNDVAKYMLTMTASTNEEVSMEACEFWSALADTKYCEQVARDLLPTLVPLLVQRMVYSDEEVQNLKADIDLEDSKVDSEKDLKPFFSSSKSKGEQQQQQQQGTSSSSSSPSNNNSQNSPSKTDYSYQNDDEEEDDDDYDEGGGRGFPSAEDGNSTLRKCAAAALDMLADIFKDGILPSLLPHLEKNLKASDWRYRESAILILGAIAPGCEEGLSKYLSQLLPLLISMLNDNEALIRGICCWTISRYSHWISLQTIATPNTQQTQVIYENKYLEAFLKELLARILDPSKRVQESACGALAILEEQLSMDLLPYLEPILKTIAIALKTYQSKNLFAIYDTLATLADHLHSHLNEPKYIEIIIPPVVDHWNRTSNHEQLMLALLECLSSLASAFGSGFLQFAPSVLSRCLLIAENILLQSKLAEQQKADFPNKDFLICALDVIGGIAEGTKADLSKLLPSDNKFALILQECAKELRPDVKQSTFGVVGDCVKHSFQLIAPVLNTIVPVLIQSITPSKDGLVGVCNNAVWAIGEITLKVGAEMYPFAIPFLEKSIPIVTKRNYEQHLLENVAVALGRFCFFCTDTLAPKLEIFVGGWCSILKKLRDDSEKESAFYGLVKIIQKNPNAVVKHFSHVCDAIASWEKTPDELNKLFGNLLLSFKTVSGNAWAQFFKGLQDRTREQLQSRYQLN